jgi:hypothetical protein
MDELKRMIVSKDNLNLNKCINNFLKFEEEIEGVQVSIPFENELKRSLLDACKTNDCVSRAYIKFHKELVEDNNSTMMFLYITLNHESFSIINNVKISEHHINIRDDYWKSVNLNIETTGNIKVILHRSPLTEDRQARIKEEIQNMINNNLLKNRFQKILSSVIKGNTNNVNASSKACRDFQAFKEELSLQANNRGMMTQPLNVIDIVTEKVGMGDPEAVFKNIGEIINYTSNYFNLAQRKKIRIELARFLLSGRRLFSVVCPEVEKHKAIVAQEK